MQRKMFRYCIEQIFVSRVASWSRFRIFKTAKEKKDRSQLLVFFCARGASSLLLISRAVARTHAREGFKKIQTQGLTFLGTFGQIAVDAHDWQ
jgi:hypothetical protein